MTYIPACIYLNCVAESVVKNGPVKCLIPPILLRGFGKANSKTLLQVEVKDLAPPTTTPTQCLP